MNISMLRDKQTHLTEQFTNLQKQAETKRQEVTDIEDELKRLQGRYAQVQDLIETESQLETAKTVTAKAKK